MRFGVLRRIPYQDSPKRYEYILTQRGLDLYPIIMSIVHWSTKNSDFDVIMPPKQTVTYVLKKAGEIDYYCRFHPNMKATLKVEP